MSANSELPTAPIRVRFILSHPIQYFTPLFRELAKRTELDFEVWYCSDESLKENKDIGFGTSITWDIPLLEGYKNRFFPNEARRPSIHFGFMGLWNPSLLTALKKEPSPTLFILHGWNYATHLMVLLSTRQFGHFLIFRGDNPDHHDRMMKPVKRFLKKLILYPLLFIPNLVYYAGKRNFLFFKMYGVPERKLIFAPHSVDNERFQINSAERKLISHKMRLQYKIPDEAVVIISPAKYIPKKRLHDIIDALALVNNPNLYLLLAGEGPSREFLQNRATEKAPGKVIFTGFINQSEMPDHYAMADILCLASGLGETWGLAVNEGMNCELPLVISDLCGCAEDLVEQGGNGYIFPVGNTTQLADYLSQLANDPSLREKMGQVSGKIIQNFAINSTVEGMMKGINKLTKNG
jgi:glycosyltransferase involved in cell wall biosynthesis